METFLSLRHINKTFHATRALRDVSLDFMSGEVHCLAGQNGCGKSTLIKIMSGVYRPDEGAEITLGGKNWSKLTPAASVAQGIQVIYQDLSLFPNLSVWENIAVNHYHHGLFVNRRRLREVAQAAMTSINVTLPLDTLVSELSIARCQLVAICRALAQDARLIIDLGERSTDLVMMYRGMPRLVRSIPGGFSLMIKTVTSALNVRADQARQFILKFGLAQDKVEGQVFKALDSTLESYASELSKSIRFKN